MLEGYERLDHFSSAPAFLTCYWDELTNGWWYPNTEGWTLLNGMPLHATISLKAGQKVDLFGSGFGHVLAPAGTPYAERALPPSKLDTYDPAYPYGYHLYEVTEPFLVEAGPIRPLVRPTGIRAPVSDGSFDPPARGGRKSPPAQLTRVLVPWTSRELVQALEDDQVPSALYDIPVAHDIPVQPDACYFLRPAPMGGWVTGLRERSRVKDMSFVRHGGRSVPGSAGEAAGPPAAAGRRGRDGRGDPASCMGGGRTGPAGAAARRGGVNQGPRRPGGTASPAAVPPWRSGDSWRSTAAGRLTRVSERGLVQLHQVRGRRPRRAARWPATPGRTFAAKNFAAAILPL